MPIANELLTCEKEFLSEISLPLCVLVCNFCGLVQLIDTTSRDRLFSSDYVYYSSFSSTWLDHAKNYRDLYIEKLRLSESSLVIEIASNDGYLLQYFKEKGIRVLGIEPSAGVAKVAIETHGVPTEIAFFGVDTASRILQQYGPADLIPANNVLAHVPDLHDFIGGVKILLKKEGVATFEFPHVLNLLANNQFDTIYHEHFSYLGLIPLVRLFSDHDLRIFDVKEIPTHGGSLRVSVCHTESSFKGTRSVENVMLKEIEYDPRKTEIIEKFQLNVESVVTQLRHEVSQILSAGQKIAAYGAAAKGNTLLNTTKIDWTQILYVVDNNPNKQNKFLPGSHIPVVSPEVFISHPPDVLLVLPWNLAAEISNLIEKSDLKRPKLLRAIPRVEYF
jgi:SAM-dependent methyltransferase